MQRLARHGLLRRRIDSRDARRSLLSLTDEGRLLDVEREGTVETAIQRALERMAPAKVQATREVLVALAESLSATADDTSPTP